MGNKVDLLGSKCGRLEVIRENPVRANDGRVKWDCVCDCGKTVTVMGKHLKSGHTQSCGCYKIEKSSERFSTHGKTRTKIYNTWCNIKERCCNPKNTSYHNYGGKGIKMHESFVDSFETFYATVGDPPDETKDWSIDRMDYTKDYEPGNLRWATPPQQAQNRGMQSNNSSGYTGVSFMDNGKNEYWVAHWVDLNGKQVSKCFSIKKLGYECAKELAIEARKDAIKQLNAQGAEYAENHGL